MKATTRLIPQEVPAPRVRTALELDEDDVEVLIEEIVALKFRGRLHPESKMHEILSTVGHSAQASLTERQAPRTATAETTTKPTPLHAEDVLPKLLAEIDGGIQAGNFSSCELVLLTHFLGRLTQ